MNSRLNFSHLCDHAFLSQDGKLNVIGIFRSLQSAVMPFFYPKLVCVTNFSVAVGEHRVVVQILKKNTKEVVSRLEGKIIAEHKKKSNVLHEDASFVEVGMINEFLHTRFEEVGIYEIEIWMDDSLLGNSFFSVEKV